MNKLALSDSPARRIMQDVLGSDYDRVCELLNELPPEGIPVKTPEDEMVNALVALRLEATVDDLYAHTMKLLAEQ